MENMVNLSTAQEGKRRQLFDIYLQLNPDEKILAAAMAVNYQPANRTAMEGCLNRLRRSASDKQMQIVGQISLFPVFDVLLKKGVMLAVDKRFRLNPQA